MNELTTCPYCSEPVADETVMLWDDRVYCRDCVEAVSPEFFQLVIDGGRLMDVTEKSDVRAIHYIINFGKIYLIGVMLLFVLPMVLAALVGWADFKLALSGFIFFGGFGIVWITLKSLIGIWLVRAYLPRIVTVQSGHLVLKRAHKTKKIPLAECAWHFGSTFEDPDCLITGLRQGIIILTPLKRIACGHSPEMLDHWFAFLKLARIPRVSPPQNLRIFVFISFWIVFVLFLGGVLGYILWIITNQKLILLIFFLSSLLWVLMVFFYGTIKYDNFDYSKKMSIQVFRPAISGGIIFPFGLFFGGMAYGLEGALICACITSLIGEASSWFCRYRMRANEREFKVEMQFVSQDKAGSEHGD